VGFYAGDRGIPGINVKNCIPQKDFQYFLDKANIVQGEYQKCVADMWNLQLMYKMSSVKVKRINVTNSSK
jgi:hypothetical protein